MRGRVDLPDLRFRDQGYQDFAVRLSMKEYFVSKRLMTLDAGSVGNNIHAVPSSRPKYCWETGTLFEPVRLLAEPNFERTRGLTQKSVRWTASRELTGTASCSSVVGLMRRSRMVTSVLAEFYLEAFVYSVSSLSKRCMQIVDASWVRLFIVDILLALACMQALLI